MIIKARLDGLSFCQLGDLDKRVAVDRILFKGSVLYGAPLPVSEVLAEHLAVEIERHIIDFSNPEITLAEVILAMELNAAYNHIPNPAGDDIQAAVFSGSFIHVSFLADVLRNYLVQRRNLDSRIKNKIDGY